MLLSGQSVGREQLCMPLQAEERLGAVFGPTVVPSLVGPNWKERLETMAYMQEKVCALAPTIDGFARVFDMRCDALCLVGDWRCSVIDCSSKRILMSVRQS